MIEHPGLQDVVAPGPVSAAAAQVARVVLAGQVGMDDAIGLVAELLLTRSRGAAVVAALTKLTPDDESAWQQLGHRARLRQWGVPSEDLALIPPPGAGPEAALTMPWMSQLVRSTGGVAVIHDRDALPPEAAEDRRQLADLGVRSLVSAALLSGDEMFGSMSLVSTETGLWPGELIQDFKLLASALVARMTLEQARRGMADAIESGNDAQDAFQQFFGSVGHELRTPVSSILGYTEVLIDEAGQTPGDPLSRSVLRDGPVIVRQCERLLGIVDSLLGAGRTLHDTEELQDVAVAEAVADVVHWHLVPAAAAGVEMVVDVDATATVRAHAAGIRQVLASLVGNAIAHHRPEGGTVRISTTRLIGESRQPMVRVIVRDDGPGMAREELDHAFDPFVRYTSARSSGSGLGLPMARTIAERDGGAVRGESTPGVGSSFWLELPLIATGS